MYLLVATTGGKWWRLDYRLKGKRKTISLGTYPDVKLKLARQLREDIAADVPLRNCPQATKEAAAYFV